MRTTFSMNGVNYDIGTKNAIHTELFVEEAETAEDMKEFLHETYGAKVATSTYDKIPVKKPQELPVPKYEFVERPEPKFEYEIPTKESLDEFIKNDYMSKKVQKREEKKEELNKVLGEDKMQIDQ